jgi:hypothetical protein
MYSWSIPSNDDRATGPQDRILHVMLYFIILKRGSKVKVCLFPIDRFASGMCGALGYSHPVISWNSGPFYQFPSIINSFSPAKQTNKQVAKVEWSADSSTSSFPFINRYLSILPESRLRLVPIRLFLRLETTINSDSSHHSASTLDASFRTTPLHHKSIDHLSTRTVWQISLVPSNVSIMTDSAFLPLASAINPLLLAG